MTTEEVKRIWEDWMEDAYSELEYSQSDAEDCSTDLDAIDFLVDWLSTTADITKIGRKNKR